MGWQIEWSVVNQGGVSRYALTIRVLRGRQCPKAGCEAADQVGHDVEFLGDVLRHCSLRCHYILTQRGHIRGQCRMCHAKRLRSCWAEERCLARKGGGGFPRCWCQCIAVVRFIGVELVQQITHQRIVLWGGRKKGKYCWHTVISTEIGRRTVRPAYPTQSAKHSPVRLLPIHPKTERTGGTIARPAGRS